MENFIKNTADVKKDILSNMNYLKACLQDKFGDEIKKYRIQTIIEYENKFVGGIVVKEGKIIDIVNEND